MSEIAVYGAPQSGKTTISINLAYALSKRDHTTLLISSEDYAELSALLGKNVPSDRSLSVALGGKGSLKNAVVEINPHFYILSAATGGDSFEIIASDEQVQDLLNKAKLAFDDIVVDCTASNSSELAAWALNESDRVLVTYGGRVSHGLWATANYRLLNPMIPKTLNVVNHTVPNFDYEALKKIVGCVDAVDLPYMSNAAQIANEQKFLCGSLGSGGRRYTIAMYDLIARLSL